MDERRDEWRDDRRLVLDTLERFETWLQRHDQTEIAVAVLKAKVAIFAALAGFIAGGAAAVAGRLLER